MVIVAVTNQAGDQLLLGRQARFPPGVYSCIAGFLEPGETVEEAAAREVAEETFVTIDQVKYHSSQFWPFPSQLMLGCHAVATSDQIKLQDDELEDAKWFHKSEVLKALSKSSTLLSIPPPTAIAHSLIKAWAEEQSSHL